MRDIPIKVNGDYLEADEWNDLSQESLNTIKDTTIPPSAGDLHQLSKSVANYVAIGDYYSITGVADVYIATKVGIHKSPTAYFDGMRIRINVTNGLINTGASTINVQGLGVKDIVDWRGNALNGRELVGLIELTYLGTKFILNNSNPNILRIQESGYIFATTAGTGTAYTATIYPAPLANVAGLTIMLKIHTNNTGAPTLNVNGLGAYSLVDAEHNTLDVDELVAGRIYTATFDGTSLWQLHYKSDVSSFATGMAMLFMGILADTPSGWLLMDDGTMAKTSGATHNGLQFELLYKRLWDRVSDTWAPVTGGGGVSAQADWDANKAITLTKQLGRALAVAGHGSGLTSRALGENLGQEGHPLTASENGTHTHNYYKNQDNTGDIFLNHYNSGAGANMYLVSTATTTSGNSTAHNTMQPTTFWNVIIKL